MPRYVAVVGPADPDAALLGLAREVGALLARAGAVLVTGGLRGVMSAASEGARGAGGTAIGLLPGTDRAAGNPFLDVALPTGLGEGRNVLVVRAADVVVSVGGSWGTLSEVALAHRTGVPVVELRGWRVLDEAGEPVPAVTARTADEAVALALALAAAG